MIFTYEYDQSFNPSFPQVAVEIFDILQPENSQQLNALIDSGADATSVPSAILRQLGARLVNTRYVRGYVGPLHPVDMFEIGLKIGGISVGYLEVIQDRSGDRILLGRDVINQLSITLNGLAGMVEIPD